MIIQLRGTSGSGKSHIVRDVLARMTNKIKFREDGRRQPIGYAGMIAGRTVAVPGHYETACGGCDTIPDLTKVFKVVEDAARQAPMVLFEGLLASEDTRRTIELTDRLGAIGNDLGLMGHQLVIINIITPLEDCLAGIQKRRDDRGDGRPLNPKNTSTRIGTINRACSKLSDQGLHVFYLDREAAALKVRELLGG